MEQEVERSVKGGRASFFNNHEVDQLLAMLMRVTSEHWALKERVLAVEALLVQQNILLPDSLDNYVAATEEQARLDLESVNLIRSVLEASQNIDSKKRQP